MYRFPTDIFIPSKSYEFRLNLCLESNFYENFSITKNIKASKIGTMKIRFAIWSIIIKRNLFLNTLQISTRIRSFFLVVPYGESSARAFVITIGGVNIAIQLHRKSSNQHKDITERYVLVHIFRKPLHNNGIDEWITIRAPWRPHGRAKFLHKFAWSHHRQCQSQWIARNRVTKLTRRLSENWFVR